MLIASVYGFVYIKHSVLYLNSQLWYGFSDLELQNILEILHSCNIIGEINKKFLFVVRVSEIHSKDITKLIF